MTTYTIDKDALTVNLMRSVGIDKHQARECADVVLQMLAAPSTSPEAIYQYQLANGNWIDQSKEMYDHIVKRGGATVRAVYLSAPSTRHSRDDVIRMAREAGFGPLLSGVSIGNIPATKIVERFAALVAAPSTSQQCEWTFSDDDDGTWASSCGELWSFIDGGPKENRVSYCHHCGHPAKIKGGA